MMYLFPKLTLAFFVMFSVVTVAQAAKLKVVASFSILGDMVKNVGGEDVDVVTLVGADADAHEFHANPGHARAVAQAGIVFINGRGFDTWASRLLKSSGASAELVTVSDRVTKRPGDPHAWQDVSNAHVYVDAISRALQRAAPSAKARFRNNAARYKADLAKLDQEIRASIASIPPASRKAITTHDAFGFFADAYGVKFIAPLGLSTHSQASAKTVAALIKQIKREKISALFLENIADGRLMAQIGRETGAAIGGRLYSDALSGAKGPAPDYISMMRANAKHLTEAMSEGS
jgi:zinc/manganese transport system substrate-binding protein